MHSHQIMSLTTLFVYIKVIHFDPNKIILRLFNEHVEFFFFQKNGYKIYLYNVSNEECLIITALSTFLITDKLHSLLYTKQDVKCVDNCYTCLSKVQSNV
jgi:hypothetical protein